MRPVLPFRGDEAAGLFARRRASLGKGSAQVSFWEMKLSSVASMARCAVEPFLFVSFDFTLIDRAPVSLVESKHTGVQSEWPGVILHRFRRTIWTMQLVLLARARI